MPKSPNINIEQKDGFIDRLEAVRGIAAIMVAAGHSFVLLDFYGWKNTVNGFLLFFLNGRAAVSLFFVLSGLVLGLSLRRSREVFGVEVARFSIRRIFRIWPAFFCCTVTIVLYLFFSHPASFPGVWESSHVFNQFWQRYLHPLAAFEIGENLCFATNSLNLIAWTLQVEVLCSLLLPFLHRFTRGLALSQRAVLFAFLMFLGFIPSIGYVRYLFMFFAGYMLPLIGPELFAPLRHEKKRMFLIVIGGLSLLLFSRNIEGRYFITHFGDIFQCAGAVAFIGALLYGWNFKIYCILDHPIAKFYGRISYSFYLWNFFWLYLSSLWISNFISGEQLLNSPFGWSVFIWVVSSFVTTIVAYISFRWIEKPFMAIGRNICERILAQVKSPTLTLRRSKHSQRATLNEE